MQYRTPTKSNVTFLFYQITLCNLTHRKNNLRDNSMRSFMFLVQEFYIRQHKR